jgi:excisionase family DNA binding protein
MDRLLSIDEAALYLGGISAWTVRAWLSQKRLARTKVGRRTMIWQSELDRLLRDDNDDNEDDKESRFGGVRNENPPGPSHRGGAASSTPFLQEGGLPIEMPASNPQPLPIATNPQINRVPRKMEW